MLYLAWGKVVFGIALLAACSSALLLTVSGRRAKRPDLILATYAPSHLEAYKLALPEFERRHGVTIGTELLNWRALESRLQNAVMSGAEVPDLTEIGLGTLGFFTRGPAADASFLDLTPRVKAAGFDRTVVASRFSPWTANGRVYALPHDVHPVMLVYRKDLVEALGIDVSTLTTWEAFVEMGRRITKDLDGDGTVDRYALDLQGHGGDVLQLLSAQRGASLFDRNGRVSFASTETRETIIWVLKQLYGPQRIAYDCKWGQALVKSMTDGLVLFYFAPDWRTLNFQRDAPNLSGKLALMQLPAWKEGGRRTSVWGGAGLTISAKTKNPDLAWKLAEYLYFEQSQLGERFAATHILPPLTTSWELPELSEPSEFYSGQALGKLFADLAPQVPPAYSAPEHKLAAAKLDEAFSRSLAYYRKHGEQGLRTHVALELESAAAGVERVQDRRVRLTQGETR